MIRTTTLLILLASVSACATPGDFCDAVRQPLEFDPATARVMVQTDRTDVENIKVQNTYGARHCTW